MVKIRLTRTGRTHDAHFRIVVADSRAPRDGKFIEIIGSYHPTRKNAEDQVIVEKDRAIHWLHKGAQPTETVRSILRKQGLMKQWHEEKQAAKQARKTEAS